MPFEPRITGLDDSLVVKGERERRRAWNLVPLSGFWLG